MVISAQILQIKVVTPHTLIFPNSFTPGARKTNKLGFTAASRTNVTER